MATQVVNLKRKEAYDVYIGRASGKRGYFGNPFRIGKDGSREEVIQKYTEYFVNRIETDPEFKARVLELKGLKLGCFCSPKICHGNVIAAWLNEQP